MSGTVTAIYFGQLLGRWALAVASVFFPIFSLLVSFPVTLSIARHALLITLWSYVFVGIANVLAGVMQSTGTVMWPAGIAIAAIWRVQLPTAYVLSRSIGLEGVWIGYPVGFIAALIAQMLYYELVWRHRR